MSIKSKVMRELARRLRSSQLGEEWEAVRDTVVALIDAAIEVHGTEETLFDVCQGCGAILCTPLDERAALVHIDTAVYFVESADFWTPSAGSGWRRPVQPRIVLIATDGPELRDCLSGSLH